MYCFTVPLLVEGKYDKAHLTSLISSPILTTDGFGVFRNPEKRALIRRLGAGGLLILCDSDGGGQLIRSRLKTQLGSIPVYNLYIPQIPGKERRKTAPSKAGFLGVEGVPYEQLVRLFGDFARTHPELVVSGAGNAGEHPLRTPVTRSMLYEYGLTGGSGSQDKRDAAAQKLGLPPGMTANAFFEAVNLISSAEELGQLLDAAPEMQKVPEVPEKEEHHAE